MLKYWHNFRGTIRRNGGSASRFSFQSLRIIHTRVTFVPVSPDFLAATRSFFFPRRVLVARFSVGFNGERFEYSKLGQLLVVEAGPFTRISSLASGICIYTYIRKR